MEPIKWDAPNAASLLCAWIRRLYEPEADESITRYYQPVPKGPITHIADSTCPPKFTIRTKNGELEGCKIIKVGVPFGRRTIIFETEDGKIVKEQYIAINRRFEEGPILEKIHEKGPFPAVVEYESYEVVKKTLEDTTHKPGSTQSGNPTTVEVELHAVSACEKRKKTRLVMLDKGKSLMEIESPRDVLIIAYDLLEGKLEPCSRAVVLLTFSQ
jgi:hypothetical protein